MMRSGIHPEATIWAASSRSATPNSSQVSSSRSGSACEAAPSSKTGRAGVMESVEGAVDRGPCVSLTLPRVVVPWPRTR